MPVSVNRSSQARWTALQGLYARARRGLWTGLGIASLLASGCEDPVRQEQIEALGAEDPRVLPGPLHRPGQPCLVCHAPSGLAGRFTVAGTVYRTPAATQPVGGVQVQLIDATRRRFIAYTNCAGNFFVYPQEFEPRMPLWVSLFGEGLHADMESAMNKDGDCATCHQGKKSPSSAGQIFLIEEAPELDAAPTPSCEGLRP